MKSAPPHEPGLTPSQLNRAPFIILVILLAALAVSRLPRCHDTAPAPTGIEPLPPSEFGG